MFLVFSSTMTKSGCIENAENKLFFSVYQQIIQQMYESSYTMQKYVSAICSSYVIVHSICPWTCWKTDKSRAGQERLRPWCFHSVCQKSIHVKFIDHARMKQFHLIMTSRQTFMMMRESSPPPKASSLGNHPHFVRTYWRRARSSGFGLHPDSLDTCIELKYSSTEYVSC